METNNDHGRANAQGWAESIAEMVAALECDYDRLEALHEERAGLESAVNDANKARDDMPAERGPESISDAYHNAHCAAMDAAGALAEWDTENGKELAELTGAATIDGYQMNDADSVRERIQEAPLSVDARTGWNNPGAADVQPEEFCILLSTGGPALRIRGELDRGMQPRRAWLEYQDWGTPWTEYHGEGCTGDDLLTFCSQFYFG